MLNWDDIKIAVIDPDFIVTEDEDIYSLQAEQRMIIFTGEPGEAGPQGEQGISATIELAPVDTLPAGSNAYALNLGDEHDVIIKFGIPRGQNGAGAVWGDIDGTLSDQVDLQTALDDKANASALDAKADIADLGTMAYKNDALSDNKQYARKNGSWVEVDQGTGAVWGDITGTLSDQTDLNTALEKRDILYFTSQAVSVATSAQIMRIPASGTDSRITADTIVLECTFNTPAFITANVSWQSYAGYVTFSGTCTAVTTANVTLGTKAN